MKRKNIVVMCIAIVMSCGLYASFQGEIKAENINVNENGVNITCREEHSEVSCDVSLNLDDAIDLSIQSGLINQYISRGSAHELTLYHQDNIITEAQWFQIQSAIPFTRLAKLDLSDVKFASGSMPENAFLGNLGDKSEFYLPKDTIITKSSLSGLKKVSTIHVTSGVTQIEENAFEEIFYEPRFSFESYSNVVRFTSDFAPFHHILNAKRLTEVQFDFSTLLNPESTPYLEHYSGSWLYIDSLASVSDKVIDFDILYGSNPGKAKLSNILILNSPKGIRISNAPRIERLGVSNTSVYVVKDCSIYRSPTISETIAFTELDISGNKIDFTSTENQAFYEKYKTSSFPLNRQKPILKLKAMENISLNVGDTIPVITPSYQYADGTVIDFTQTPPSWIDTEYYNTYASKVTYSDNATMNTENPGTITRTYKSEGGDILGSIKVIVSANADAKETPTIALTKTGVETPTSDDELTFTATITKTGTNDVNTDAKVKFMDGATLLSVEVVVDGKAEYTTKLSAGQHSITAIYSGNTNFNTVTSDPAIAIAVTPSSSSLTAQTIGFTNSSVSMDLGDSVPSNPITQSDSHGTGAITYESSDTSVATVDSSGTVTVLKAGTTTIKATIAADTTYDSANGSYTLTITTPSSLTAQTLSFDKTTESVHIGDTVNNPLTKDTPASTGTITYESSDPTVAMVDNTGVVTLLKAGTTTITATIGADSTYDSASASYTLLVSAVGGLTTQTLEFSNASVAITYGESVSNPITQSDPHGTGTITYKSSDESIATVDTTGSLTVLKAGTTTITASIAADSTYDSATDSYELTIHKKPITVTGLKVKDKVYDGKTKVVFDTENTKAEGILSNDVSNIKFMLGSGTYQDAKAGVDKAIVLKDFNLQGSSSENYELVLPTITGTITKAELVVNVKDMERKEGTENMEFTYFMTGFVNNESESTLSGYTKPTLETSANKTSPAGTYAITAKNASSDNYSFTYKNGVLTIKAESIADDKSYSIEGVIGKNGWYTSKVKIKPKSGFTKIYNGKTWGNEISYADGIHKDIKLKFKKLEEVESNEVTIPELKVDTTPPSAQNIKNGDTYFINRAFQAKDDHVVKVRINGKEVVKEELQVIADASKSYSIELEDEAGNVTSLKVDTKSLEDTMKPIESITVESVEAKDKATIENMLAKVEDLLKDTTYSPTSEQKKQLEETKEKCETLLKQLEAKNVGNEQLPGNIPTNNGVNTGDTSNILIYGVFTILAFISIVSLKRRT